MDSGKSSPSNLVRSQSLRLSNFNRTSLVRRNQSVSAKQVKFFRNGDQYFSGLRLAVSIDRYKEFESLLTELSSKLNLPTGAVRYLFNADDGSLVSDVSQLQNGISYVCSSSASFRQIEGGYGKLVPNWSNIKKSRNIYRPLKVLGNIENSFRLDSSKDFIKPKLVTVIRNGKPPQRKVTLLLNNKTAISLDQVLDQLSAKGSLGKVDKLHTTSGKPIRALRDLFDDNTVFIALSTNEKFPDDGIELDPNSYRITPYREMKKSNQMAVRRSNSLRHNMRYKDENENMSLSNIRNLKNGALPKHALSARQSVQPRIRTTSRKEEQKNKEELYPTSVFASDSESDCEYDVYSMFGIKREKHSVHSQYKIGRIIGDGNFAIVRECRDRKTQKPFALKIINKAKVKGKEHMIENEILILRKISHPNIVKLHEEFETPKEIYLVMELVPGGDLFDAIVDNTRFSEPESAYMVHDLASAILYLHELNIVHRDVKPENLLIVNREDGRKSIKLADFGLSIEVKSPMFLVCGTPTYVAPEILDESGYGLEVDNWAIGVICYILLCGFPPFRSTNHDQEELFDKILRGDYEYLKPFWNDVGDGPRDLIDRLLVVDASERYTAKEILQHFWIKKWTEPVEKIHRELSQAEEANMKNRKRLRGIALAIQSVISLLHLVRSRNNSKLSSSLQPEDEDSTSRSSPQAGSRIPRPTSASSSPNVTNFRKGTTTPVKRRGISSAGSRRIPYDQPDYSLKKGFLKREEKVDTGTLKKKKVAGRSKISVPTTPVRKPKTVKPAAEPSLAVTSFKDNQVRFRPCSVIDIRVDVEVTERPERPGSAQGYRKKPTDTRKVKDTITSVNEKTDTKVNKTPTTTTVDKTEVKLVSKSSSDNIIGDSSGVASNGVKLRKKTSRTTRPNTMLELSTSAATTKGSAVTTSSNKQKDVKDVKEAAKNNISSAKRSRPVSLMINKEKASSSRKSLTPSTEEFNRKRMQYRLNDQLHSLDENIKQDNSGRMSPKKNSKFKLSNLSSPRCRSPTRKKETTSAKSTKENRPGAKPLPVRPASSLGTTNRDRSSSLSRRTPKNERSPIRPATTIPPSPKKTMRERSASGNRSTITTKRATTITTPKNSATTPSVGSPSTARKPKSTPTKGGTWNVGTAVQYKAPNSLRKPLSPKKTVNTKITNSPKHVQRKTSEAGKVRITTEVNKRKNITFPDGKKVDKETNTKTTVSVDMNDSEGDKTVKRASLLAKVKTLAQEIGSLSKLETGPVSESSSDSIQGVGTPVRSHSDVMESVIKEDTDRFSETEYLSLSEKP